VGGGDGTNTIPSALLSPPQGGLPLPSSGSGWSPQDLQQRGGQTPGARLWGGRCPRAEALPRGGSSAPREKAGGSRDWWENEAGTRGKNSGRWKMALNRKNGPSACSPAWPKTARGFENSPPVGKKKGGRRICASAAKESRVRKMDQRRGGERGNGEKTKPQKVCPPLAHSGGPASGCMKTVPGPKTGQKGANHQRKKGL